MSTKRILLSLLTFLVVICLGISVIAVAAAGLVVWQSQKPAASATPVNRALPTLIPGKNDTLPAELTRQMDQIQREVLGIRGLALKTPVNRGLLTPDQLLQKVRDDFLKDYSAEDSVKDGRVLSAFGLLKPNFDLRDFYLRLYAEQIAGFYDSKTKEMFVVQGKAFAGTERMTYAHEFEHVLQDQNYDIREGLKYNETYCKTNTEYCSAISSLLEGDATLAEQEWFSKYATAQDKKDVQDFYSTYKSPVYDSAPPYMKEDFLFPYQRGLEFVQTIYDRGGWSAINDVFKNPPISTEQILHPERYPKDIPQPIPLPDLTTPLGSGWKRLDQNVMGEWYAYLVFANAWDSKHRLPAATARKATTGWTGDTYALYWNDAQNMPVLAWRTRWETRADTEEFWSALLDYGSKRWGKPDQTFSNRMEWNSAAEGMIYFARTDQDVLWLIAPDSAVVNAILGALPEFPKR